ncbi:MAG: hypothetical protein ACRCT6_02255 [Notoacmeibacter sp.]
MRAFAIILLVLLGLSSAANADPVADFKASDTSKDGLLQKEEFKTFVKHRAKAGNASARWVVRFGAWGRALKTVDTNNDLIVTPAELRAFDAKD